MGRGGQGGLGRPGRRDVKRGGEGHASAPCAATTCFSCAIAAAPASCHLINAVDHLGTREGSLGWLWANPPSLLRQERPPPACYSSGSHPCTFLSPFPMQRSVPLCPRGDGVLAIGKGPPTPTPALSWSRIQCRCLELSLPKEKAESVK